MTGRLIFLAQHGLWPDICGYFLRFSVLLVESAVQGCDAEAVVRRVLCAQTKLSNSDGIAVVKAW
eukprot:51512-Eustigmatos_ZCMA.PRE.1